MPDNDVQFIITDARAIYNEIITALEAEISGPLYPGDERRIFGEALVAVFVAAYSKVDDAAKQKLLRYARGPVLDALGERTNTPRITSTPAETVIRFTVTTPQPQNIIIPQWTKVTSDGSVYFATNQTAVLQAGAYTVDIPSSSIGNGSMYNGILPGTLRTLVDLIPYIASVSNIDTTHAGSDGEPYTEEGDNSYRERIRLAVARFSTAGPRRAYEYFALSADPDIASVSVISPEPGHIVLVPLMENGGIPSQEVLDKVLEKCNADDVRPLTDFVSAEAPEQTSFDISFKYYVTAETEAAAIETIEGENGAIQQYIKWQTGQMGRDINPDQLRRFVLRPDWSSDLTGALRLDVSEPTFQVLDGLTVAQHSGNIEVAHEVVEE